MSDVAELAESTIDVGNLMAQDGTKKAEYLSYRVCNCTIRESTKLAKVTERMVRYWRANDQQFAYIDGEGLTNYRQKFANNLIDMEFTKNFRLILQKDFAILYKSLIHGDESLSDKEHQYLLKIRSHYSPQNLAAIKQLLAGGTIQEPFDFTKTVLTIRRDRQELEIRSE